MARSKYLEDTLINIALGRVHGADLEPKFGAVPQMSQSTYGTCWDINDTLYPWYAFDSSSGILTIDRASGADSGKEITLIGLDDNYIPITDTISLNLPTNNIGSKLFKRIYRSYVDNGSLTNEGLITVRKDGIIVAGINANKGQTLMGVYTVPAGKTALILNGTSSAEAGKDGTGDLMVRFADTAAFRVKHTFEVSGSSPYDHDFKVPIPVPERSDIDLRITTRTNNGRYTAAWDMILVDNV